MACATLRPLQKTSRLLMPVAVLREIQHTDVLQPYPDVLSYLEGCDGRPAWLRCLAAYKKRLEL
jgi:glutathione S-transferase